MFQSVLRRLLVLLIVLAYFTSLRVDAGALAAPTACTGEFIPVSTPLNDLGGGEYVRLQTGPTGFTGGLYPGGSNTRPPAHEAAGVALARQIVPLDTSGNPDPDGRIVLISIGMSNTNTEFYTFVQLARNDPDRNRQVALVNGAQPGMVATSWADPDAPTWTNLDSFLAAGGFTPSQVQVAWIKLTNYDLSQFPGSILILQDDLKAVVRNLKAKYPNVRLAYLSSRTRAYQYWTGLNPEPGAFETGFAVRWLIEAQINGDPELNYNPALGPVVAPYLSWGPYLWIDGTNPRSDGMVWTQDDLGNDCVHPSASGNAKVAAQLLAFFKSDSSTQSWFLVHEHKFFFLPAVIAAQ
jgi:hypothetical protein